jgi:hypothetical protein
MNKPAMRWLPALLIAVVAWLAVWGAIALTAAVSLIAGIIFGLLSGLIPSIIAFNRRLTDNYVHGEPRFTVPDLVCWWVIGIAFFPIALFLSLINEYGTGSARRPGAAGV